MEVEVGVGAETEEIRLEGSLGGEEDCCCGWTADESSSLYDCRNNGAGSDIAPSQTGRARSIR